MTKKQLDMMKKWLNEVLNNAWEDGAREERAAVVAWLREHGDQRRATLADRIERGEHRREVTE